MSVYASAFPAVASAAATNSDDHHPVNVLNIHVQTFISIYSQRKFHHVSILPNKLSLRVKNSKTRLVVRRNRKSQLTRRITGPPSLSLVLSTTRPTVTLLPSLRRLSRASSPPVPSSSPMSCTLSTLQHYCFVQSW